MANISVKKPSSVDRVYAALRDMAIAFRFRPGKRVNEVDLARELKTSRTPLREALNRLVAEGFLRSESGRGFFCRDFRPREIYELYQLRTAIEVSAVRRACELASERELEDLARFLDETGPNHQGRTAVELVALDEHFHRAIMALTRNSEMERVLDNVNARIKFFRWIDMESRRGQTQAEHRQVLEALRDRDADRAGALMQAHIARRLDQITDAMKEGVSRLRADGETQPP